MSGEDVAKIKYPVVEQAKEALDGWLAFYIINAATPMLKKAPQWQRIFLFCLYFEIVFATVWLLPDSEPVTLIQATVVAVALFFAMNFANFIAKHIIDILHTEIAPNLPPAISESAGRMLKKRFSLRKQLLVSIPSASIVASIDFILLSPVDPFGNPLSILFSGVVIVSFLSLVSFLLFLWSLSFLPVIFLESQVELYPLDPIQSPLVQGSLTIAQRTVWFLVIVMMIYLGVNALFLRDASELLLLLPIPIAVIVIGIAALFFIQQQFNLSLLVNARRTRTLLELQNELSSLYARGDSVSKDELARRDDLLATHDRVTQTGERAFDLPGIMGFFLPLLLPLLSSLLGALPFREEIIAFLGQILSP